MSFGEVAQNEPARASALGVRPAILNPALDNMTTPNAMLRPDATTRTATVGHARIARGGRLLSPAQTIISPESGLHYRVERWLGEGGFGQVYLATRRSASTVVPETVCIKVSARIDGWLREAYFGQLLDDHPRAIRVFDAFPLVRAARARAASCTASSLEYAPHGDLSAFLSARRPGLA